MGGFCVTFEVVLSNWFGLVFGKLGGAVALNRKPRAAGKWAHKHIHAQTFN